VSLSLTKLTASGHSLGVEERAPAFDDGPRKILSLTPPCALAKPTLEEIYRAHFGFVWRGVRALGVASEAIDDVVQEIFLIAHRRLPEFEGRSSVRTWLSGIMLNAARHHRRTASRKQPYERSREAPTDVDTLPTAADSPHDLTVTHERTRLLERILEDLGEKKREILVLAELEELTAAEIAQILGLSANTVSSRLRLARQDFERLAARYRARERGRVQ
jgi:RNA polymerase sigma-70 factor (ECF subfamily)